MHLINQQSQIAKRLPDNYQGTPIYISPNCGGFSEGLIMVSLMDEIELAYFHHKSGCAGLWGWIDIDFNVVIEPKYIFAENFINGKASVAKGKWVLLDNGCYDWENEAWGIIDLQGNEIIPCLYDEIYPIDNTDILYLAHKGGWKNGNYCIINTEIKEEILQLDFEFDAGYMFNELFVENNYLIFINHISGKETDLIYVYNLLSQTFIIYGEEYNERTLNGQRKIVVNKDGKEVIVF